MATTDSLTEKVLEAMARETARVGDMLETDSQDLQIKSDEEARRIFINILFNYISGKDKSPYNVGIPNGFQDTLDEILGIMIDRPMDDDISYGI